MIFQNQYLSVIAAHSLSQTFIDYYTIFFILNKNLL